MPTVRQIQSAKKTLRPTKRPNNAPKIPNVATFRIIMTDPRTIRMKEANKYRKEMETHKKQYMAALAKLKRLEK